MSTSVHSVEYSSSWKQEVNRRIAEHKKNKPSLAAGCELVREHRNDPSSRAAQAAARVAARYANAPSYSEMLASEARAAVLAAEAASRAARAAQAAAQSVLDSLDAAASAESARHPEENNDPFLGNRVQRAEDVERAETAAFAANPAGESAVSEAAANPGAERSGEYTYAIRWEPELPAPRSAPIPVRTPQMAGLFDSSVPEWPEQGSPEEESELVEPAQPIYGNLIEFPRQLVATRKVRPRRVEGPLATAGGAAQLSIFEVDPGAISIEPEAKQPGHEPSAPAWTGAEWSGIKLDAHPEAEVTPREASPECKGAATLKLASVSRRLLAIVVDASLVAGAFLLLAILVASRMAEVPGMHAMEIGTSVALLLGGALYMALFSAFARTTPGMWYARLRLCTFEGTAPTRAQRNARMVALLLSALPMGLGLAWAIFDEDHLAWHDRLSHTYLRRC